LWEVLPLLDRYTGIAAEARADAPARLR